MKVPGDFPFRLPDDERLILRTGNQEANWYVHTVSSFFPLGYLLEVKTEQRPLEICRREAFPVLTYSCCDQLADQQK